MKEANEDEIQRADPAAQKKALFLVLIVAAVGVVAMWAFESAFTGVEENVDDDPVEAVSQMVSTIRVFAAMTAILTMAIAVWIWLLSSRIFKAERFPPPGMALVRDVRIVSGVQARMFARVGFVAAGLCAVGAIVLPLMLLRLVSLITEVEPGPGG